MNVTTFNLDKSQLHHYSYLPYYKTTIIQQNELKTTEDRSHIAPDQLRNRHP
jgi:hypothetical protein